jgi:hypothetical protein
MQMSAEQIMKLHEMTEATSNRPLQAIGAREVVELVP